MKKGLTELVIIIDKSGSMGGLESDVIGGYNKLIEDQRKLDGEVLVTTVFFNHEFTLIHNRENIKNVKTITKQDYQTSGCTALLDAVGSTVSSIKQIQEGLKIEEIPEHTIVSIMTDGLENSSKEYNYKQIKKLIETLKEAGWDFIFQAANIDAFEEGDKLGIDAADTSGFKADSKGVKMVFCMGSAQIKRKRTTIKKTSKTSK